MNSTGDGFALVFLFWYLKALWDKILRYWNLKLFCFLIWEPWHLSVQKNIILYDIYWSKNKSCVTDLQCTKLIFQHWWKHVKTLLCFLNKLNHWAYLLMMRFDPIEMRYWNMERGNYFVYPCSSFLLRIFIRTVMELPVRFEKWIHTLVAWKKWKLHRK